MTAIASEMPAEKLLLVDFRNHYSSNGFGRSDYRPQHQHKTSTLSSSKSRRSLASLAKEKTSAAIATFSLATAPVQVSQNLRSVTSSGSLSTQSAQTSSTSTSRPGLTRTRTSTDVAPEKVTFEPPLPSHNMALNNNNNSKMHQTSSKILRMTDDDRPYTRDFKDLFATLITSLPMDAHRVRFTKVEETFLSEEAINNLGSLKFSQSNRIPDPKNPQRWVVTTTTTTFSMAKEMARSVCQRFVDARLIESADQKNYTAFPIKGGLWQLTPKGISVLKRFCDRNGVEASHIEPMIRRQSMNIVALERDNDTDKLIQDRSTVEVIFRRFAGTEGPNVKSTVQLSDSDSLSEYSSGLVGVKMAKDRRIADRIFHNTFTGKAASDWLLDCCTTIDRRETYEICELFVRHQLIVPIMEDRGFVKTNSRAAHFQPTKNAIYTITDKGQRVCGWVSRPPSMSSEESREGKEKSRVHKDTNMSRLTAILNDAALRMLFKEHLRRSLCEENLNFYLDAQQFTAGYRQLEASDQLSRTEAVRETLATAYGLYNSFLASGAPSELNMDHGLRHKLDNRMTQTDSDDLSMQDTLKQVVELIELASSSVFKLMATDSVPKFIRDPRYQQVFREHEFDISIAARAMSPAPDDTLSRSNTVKRSE